MADIIIIGTTFEDHVNNVRRVLRQLCQHGVKAKCNILKDQVCYFGWIISAEGYKSDSKETETLKKLKQNKSRTVGVLRKLLGLTGYYTDRHYLGD